MPKPRTLHPTLSLASDSPSAASSLALRLRMKALRLSVPSACAAVFLRSTDLRFPHDESVEEGGEEQIRVNFIIERVRERMRRERGGERGGGRGGEGCQVREVHPLCMCVCIWIPSRRETGGRPLSLRRNGAQNVGDPHICLPRAIVRPSAGTVDPGANADAPAARATIRMQTLGMAICRI
jgi:hypothetical protein